MKLGISYNIWDGEELLERSILSVYPLADFICVVVQNQSNYGELYDGALKECRRINHLIDRTFTYHPDLRFSPAQNERHKRNIGLELCKQADCTHYISMDCDEFYDTNEMLSALEEIEKKNYDATACRLYTYFKSPTLRLNKPEDYYVPFVHRIYSNSTHTNKYPVYCDPTRGMKPIHNFSKVDLFMHHFSWVRKDINRKVRNSSARANLEKTSWSHDYARAAPGGHINLYNCNLIRVPDYFGLKSLQFID